MNLKTALQAAGNRSRYEMSEKQENSPLGWGSTLKNIKKASDIDFKKHAAKFYSFGDFSITKLWFPIAAVVIFAYLFRKER